LLTGHFLASGSTAAKSARHHIRRVDFVCSVFMMKQPKNPKRSPPEFIKG
jgi:hypothetical protein